MTPPTPYTPTHKIRLVTAASLFDGHDAAINIMRRIMQATGVEVIHLGHNRSVQEIVDCAIQEDVQGIAITSYQGGHVEYFKYMHDLLKERGAGHIKLFGGGGGTILPDEIAELHAYGISRIYSPDDGREMGLQGMINDVIKQCDYANLNSIHPSMIGKMTAKDHGLIGRVITIVENDPQLGKSFMEEVEKRQPKEKVIPILGITGTGGAGKSSLTDELVRRFLMDFEDKTIAVLSVDPSKRKTGGALLGDRIRMNAIFNSRVYMRSMATRQANIAMSEAVDESVKVFRAAGFDLIVVETAGIGQSDSEITEVADVSLYVMTPEYGAATQLEKIDMIDYADLIAINKFDKRGALDALRDVKKQYQRTRNLWHTNPDEMPVFGTIASQFNDPGTNQLYRQIMRVLHEKTKTPLDSHFAATDEMSEKIYIIPPDRTRYLAEISEENDRFEKWVKEQAQLATTVYNLEGTISHLKTLDASHAGGIDSLSGLREDAHRRLAAESQDILNGWENKGKQYRGEFFSYEVRGKEIKVANYTESLSHTKMPKIALPRFKDYGEILRWSFRENVPGEFPYTAGVYPFKRTGEDPTRMFAGEGGPERTNKRFHYVSKGLPAARLSTAFDSVTLYGEDPDYRPDIYGKIGNSGVSIACLDDAKRLYSGFDLCKPTTSVSMTINGPAPMLLAYYMNTAVDQQCEKYIKENGLEGEVRQKIRQIFADRNVGLTAHQGKSTITRIEALEEGFRVHYKSGEGEYNWVVMALGYLRFWADDPKKVVVIPQYRSANSEAYLSQLKALGQSLIDQRDNQSFVVGESWWELDSCEVVEVEENLFDIRYRLITEGGIGKGERFLWHSFEQGYFSRREAFQPIPPAPNALPEGNDGLGLMLLGVTGDQVLPADVYAKIRATSMSTTRGTVQADILKEDQAQNTCIFSTEFALRMMGDIQQYFIDHAVRNFYSVSISGYHIAEAGANPITQLAFTLSNGFTYVEYYLSRGMNIDDFAPNLSFFFSNGMDPEYAVIGRVARRIWAKAIKNKYGGNERSQMLKYHIQTSGRSLHAQEIAFNDIRTTLQALYAIYDNCNSLHTNAYDEAITTPTEDSVRRAMAIQLIINKELGQANNENPLQGSFIIEELTDLVEDAVMTEFKRLTDRGGALGAMETMYQRSKIQEESLYYEMQKHTGELPIVGVNTFLSSEGSPTIIPKEVIRSTEEEKVAQITDIHSLQLRNAVASKAALRTLQLAAIKNANLFEALMEAGKVCSLGQMTHALYEVGGQYRRNM